jgi:hypothetical protein
VSISRARQSKSLEEMSQCVRLFIEKLFDQAKGEHSASPQQNQEVQSALSKTIKKEELAMSVMP